MSKTFCVQVPASAVHIVGASLLS
ncbi:hypothetical protein NC652_006754 [Populus alba x Populus x berolinensis]|nr:hypothetical protein NC652_006754 [Populus alba x Populus x berolinensis]